MGAFVLAAVVLAAGFFLAGMCWARITTPKEALRVVVGPSTQDGKRLQHMISAGIKDRSGWSLHFERVDLREDGYEECLAEAVARMKQKLRVIEAARQIAGEE